MQNTQRFRHLCDVTVNDLKHNEETGCCHWQKLLYLIHGRSCCCWVARISNIDDGRCTMHYAERLHKSNRSRCPLLSWEWFSVPQTYWNHITSSLRLTTNNNNKLLMISCYLMVRDRDTNAYGHFCGVHLLAKSLSLHNASPAKSLLSLLSYSNKVDECGYNTAKLCFHG
jgi:hypothetical protein